LPRSCRAARRRRLQARRAGAVRRHRGHPRRGGHARRGHRPWPAAGLCKPAPAAQPPQAELDRGLRALIDKPAPPPGKAFDNLYFVGADWVSAWAIKTSDGIILIDALNNQVEAAALIEGGMRKLGLDPAQIRYVVVTHGHGDHYGGAPYLAQKYGARVVMSEADWTDDRDEAGVRHAGVGRAAQARRERRVGEGRRPPHAGRHHRHAVPHAGPHHGHDLAGVRRERGRPEAPRAAVGRHGLQLRQERAAAGELHRRDAAHGSVVQAQKIDVLVSNHSGYDGSQGKLAALRQQPAGAANPFVLGTPTVERALNVMGECAQAQRDRFAMQ
jgi:metallo-beta-lactamase class B